MEMAQLLKEFTNNPSKYSGYILIVLDEKGIIQTETQGANAAMISYSSALLAKILDIELAKVIKGDSNAINKPNHAPQAPNNDEKTA